MCFLRKPFWNFPIDMWTPLMYVREKSQNYFSDSIICHTTTCSWYLAKETGSMQLATYHSLSIISAATSNHIFTGSFKNWGDMQASVLLTLFQKIIFPNVFFCLRRSKGGLPLVWPVFTVLPNPFPAKTIITITLTLSLVKTRCGSWPNLSSGECTLDFWVVILGRNSGIEKLT